MKSRDNQKLYFAKNYAHPFMYVRLAYVCQNCFTLTSPETDLMPSVSYMVNGPPPDDTILLTHITTFGLKQTFFFKKTLKTQKIASTALKICYLFWIMMNFRSLRYTLPGGVKFFRGSICSHSICPLIWKKTDIS